MRSKPTQIIFFQKIKLRLRALSLVLVFIFFQADATSQSTEATRLPTIKEFNEQREAKKQAEYLNFREQWFAFLRKEIKVWQGGPVQPAWARKATEEFFIQSGGLKAEFALASKKNTYGFTFTQPEDDNLSRKASYHRARQSIFMNFEKMSANEWLLLFVHEVAHSLDSELFKSLPIYNDGNYIKKLASWGASQIRLDELAPEERQNLKAWLTAGLNRGLLAEYRAWLLTYAVYEEGHREGLIEAVPWLENLRNSKPKDVSMKDHIYRYLSPSWVDPKIDMFSHAFIQQALRELREELYANPGLIQMGNIQPFVQQQ